MKLSDFKLLMPFLKSGILLTTIIKQDGSTGIQVSPVEYLTPILRSLLTDPTTRGSLLAEITTWESSAQTLLWVTPSLDTHEDSDPRYGWTFGSDPVWRVLDPECYAYLWGRMTKLKEKYDAGGVDANSYSLMKERFLTLHNWAVSAWGMEVLATANETARLKALLLNPGYAVLQTPYCESHIVITRDEAVKIARDHAYLPRFQLSELRGLQAANPEAIRQLCDIKMTFAYSTIGGFV